MESHGVLLDARDQRTIAAIKTEAWSAERAWREYERKDKEYDHPDAH